MANQVNTLVVTGPYFQQIGIGSAIITPTGASAGVALANAVAAPLPGKVFYVNETLGNDSNVGSQSSPLLTLSAALALCDAGNNNIVYFTGSIHLTAALAWNKNNVHLIGLGAPMRRGKRARISVTGSTGFSPLVNVTGSGCYFSNFGTFFGWANSAANCIAWQDTGGRNAYDNVEFMGFGDDTGGTGTANTTAARTLLINSSTGESTFTNCVFGVDTAKRNVTNYTVEIQGGAPRITFQNCDFESWLGSSGTGASHFLIGSGGIDRYLDIVSCRFWCATKSGGGSTMAQVLNVSASAGGFVSLSGNTTAFGATHWETAASGSVVLSMGVPTAHDGGISVAASPS